MLWNRLITIFEFVTMLPQKSSKILPTHWFPLKMVVDLVPPEACIPTFAHPLQSISSSVDCLHTSYFQYLKVPEGKNCGKVGQWWHGAAIIRLTSRLLWDCDLLCLVHLRVPIGLRGTGTPTHRWSQNCEQTTWSSLTFANVKIKVLQGQGWPGRLWISRSKMFSGNAVFKG